MKTIIAIALAAVCSLVEPPQAHAATCNFNVRAKNSGKVAVIVGLGRSQVQIKDRSWKAISCKLSQIKLGAGASSTVGCTLTAGNCNKQRRYKFPVKIKDKPLVWKHQGWTTSTTIDLGDVGQ